MCKHDTFFVVLWPLVEMEVELIFLIANILLEGTIVEFLGKKTLASLAIEHLRAWGKYLDANGVI